MPGTKPRPMQSSASSPTLGRGGRAASGSVALYATPSHASLCVEPDDLEPGPGHYDLPRNFGYQQESTKISGAVVSLTAKHEKSWDKVFVTKDHCQVLLGKGTPGPGAYDPGLGPASQARIRFGTGQRQPLNDGSFRAPGPVYDVAGDSDSVEKKQRFGKASRFDAVGDAVAPASAVAPGQYEAGTLFDGARLGKSFGASHRAYDKVRFPGSDRLQLCKASPGPGSLQPFTNSGKSITFPHAERLPLKFDGRPGPGAYDNHERAYPHSRNQSCYSFGTPSARGRIDYKQMRSMGNSMWGVH
jgi:hypothetical protein